MMETNRNLLSLNHALELSEIYQKNKLLKLMMMKGMID